MKNTYMPITSRKLRLVLLWLPEVALSLWALADTVFFIYQRFGQLILPDKLALAVIFSIIYAGGLLVS